MFQSLGILFELLHTLIYQSNGRGNILLDVMSTIFDMISECLTSLLILMMVNGWFTRYEKFDMDNGIEIYGPLWILVLMVHIIFGAFTFID